MFPIIMITIVTCTLLVSLRSVARASQPDVGDARQSRRTLQQAIVKHAIAFGAVYLALLVWGAGSLLAQTPHPAEADDSAEAGAAPPRGLSVGDGLGMLGIALATSVSVLGASYAVAVVGSAALGAITEKPELFGRALVFIGLAEGLAIYGLIISILMLGRLQ